MNAYLILLSSALYAATPIPFTAPAAASSGSITVDSTPESANVHWNDAQARPWTAQFSLDPAKPLITAISVDGKAIIQRAQPVYRASTGKRRGGFDQFFDFPPSHPDGTRSFLADFHPTGASAQFDGDRLDIAFDGLKLGIFQGSLHYIFFPGSKLIQQRAIVSTSEPDTAFFYDAGIRISVDEDRRAGGRMETKISYFDTEGKRQTVLSPHASEWNPVAVRYRTIATTTGAGSVAVFPPPHRYFMARDYTSNMGYLWHTAWRGSVYLGIRQLPDDNSPYYPWMNAPPGTQQELDLFLLVDDRPAAAVLDSVLPYTHQDKYPALAGYKTFAPHWHLAYTVQAMENGNDWTPPFKPVFKDMGINMAMIMDFHGDGHPSDTTETRLKELKAYFDACRAQSDPNFLLIPSEEMNTYLGGHWGIIFPKPVYWFMKRNPNDPFRSTDPKYGTVYHVGNAKDAIELINAEHGYMYQTHPRTKGSTGFPDEIKNSEQLTSAFHLGAGWKAMNTDLSSPRLGDRGFKTVDDMNNWGLHKRSIGEVDVFQLDSTHELYGHMNLNYLRLPATPTFDHWADALSAVAKGEYFTTTGEVLLPAAAIQAQGDQLKASATVSWTFPLRMAEIVWGDGSQTHRQVISLNATKEFGKQDFSWEAAAPNWKWARLAVWDVAGNGAFNTPLWRDSQKVVALDGFHNNESKMPDHYQWDGTRMGGFSELAKVIQSLNAETRTIRERITSANLAGVNVLVIVDPDTPAETDDPKYIEPAEIDAIDKWVRAGGRLVLLGNDKGNAEFQHFNQLAARFGIEFLEETYPKVQGKGILIAEGHTAIFQGAPKVYLVEVAPLKLTGNAETVLEDKGTPIMALAHAGKGQVFALGDPWVYNEYIGRNDNRAVALNLFRSLLQ